MYSGWASKVDADDYRGFDGSAQHYPGFHVDAAKMLMEETQSASLAVDTFSLAHGLSADFAAHNVAFDYLIERSFRLRLY